MITHRNCIIKQQKLLCRKTKER